MKNRILMQLSFLILLLLHSVHSYSDEDMYKKIDNEIQFLTPYIDSFPPAFKSEKEKNEIVKRYDESKKQLDAMIEKNPENVQLKFKRGHLQSLGHNADLPDAWKGAETDLLEVINLDPTHKGAFVSLAILYVNTDPSFALKAESLFKNAQEMSGQDYKEAIQRGLFFAYYYQGKLDKAHTQAKLLVKNWPQSNYNVLLEVFDKG